MTTHLPSLHEIEAAVTTVLADGMACRVADQAATQEKTPTATIATK